MKKCIIIVPVYKKDVSLEERISLESIAKHINYPICFVIPNGLDINNYKRIIPNAEYKEFNDEYFEGFSGYNKMMTSKFFYESFKAYEKIVICQTDVLILSDNLNQFVNMDYDYIGSPMVKLKPWENRLYVGNGGFSIRNVNACIKVVEKVKDKDEAKNEDNFFSSYGESNPETFRVAPLGIAIKFSFDQPLFNVLYRLNGNNLPVGIHGWFNYDTSLSKACLQKYVGDFEFSSQKTYEEIRNNLIEVIKKSDLIYFYGAGDFGRMMSKFCAHNNLNFSGFLVSDDQAIKNKIIDGVEVRHLSECDDLSDATIIITILQRYRRKQNYDELLKKIGVKHIYKMDDTMCFVAIEEFLIDRV